MRQYKKVLLRSAAGSPFSVVCLLPLLLNSSSWAPCVCPIQALDLQPSRFSSTLVPAVRPDFLEARSDPVSPCRKPSAAPLCKEWNP